MKLSTRQIVTAILLALLGAGELVIQAQDNTEARAQNNSETASEDAKKADASNKPRGLLADSFFWPSTTDVNPRKSTPLTPPPLPGLADRPLTGATERLVVPSPIVAGPILPVPATEMRSSAAPVVSAADMPMRKPVAARPIAVAPPVVAAAEKPAVYLAETTFVAPSSQLVEPPGQQLLVQPASWSMNNTSMNPATDQQLQQLQQLQQNVQQLQQNVQQVQQAQHAQQYIEPAPVSLAAVSSCSDADGCSPCDCCPDPLWMHRSGAFADFLYLRPGNIDYVYAVEQTGTQPSDVQTGAVGRVGFDTTTGYRVGLTHCLSDCSSLQVNYTWFQDSTHDSITANGINVLIFQPGLPQIPNVGSSSIQSSADYNIRFQQLDIDFRGLLYGTCDTAINYFAGVRYANLEQNFRAQQDVGVPVGLTAVRTDINFDGFGIGAGLDGMRRRADTGLLVYGKASASFLSGEFKADYRQTQQFGPNSIAGNTLADFRVMTILQTELGLGWRSCCGRYQLTGGYQFSGWFNALTTGSYIPGVQSRQYSQLYETISFDGLVARVQVQF